jgi:hypothetical protein
MIGCNSNKLNLLVYNSLAITKLNIFYIVSKLFLHAYWKINIFFIEIVFAIVCKSMGKNKIG